MRERHGTDLRIAGLFGLLDGLSPLGYLVMSDPLTVQIFALGAKLLLAMAHMRLAKISPTAMAISTVLVAMMLIGASVDAAYGQFSSVATLRYLAFTLSLFLTLCLVRHETVWTYCRHLVVTPLLVGLIHIAMAQAGALLSNGTRVFYVGGGHPNLGGEISAAAALAAAVAFRMRWAMPILAVFFYSAMLMQSRAALIVIAMIAMVVLLRAVTTGLQKNWLALLLVQIPLLAAIALIANWEVVSNAFDVLMLIDDPTRGATSGVTGRYEQWALGWDLFAQSPVFGTGLTVFESGQIDSPHNAFLFGLSQHGILSLVFWMVIVAALARSARIDLYFATMALSFSVLLMLNDRFINLNQYPFCFFALVLIMGGRPTSVPVVAPVQTKFVAA